MNEALNLRMSTQAHGVQLWTGLKMPAGCQWFWIMDTRNGNRIVTEAGSCSTVALAIFRETLAAAAPAAPQIESPLAPAERQCSGLAGPSGSAANKMSEPVRNMLAAADRSASGMVCRGKLSNGDYPLSMLRAAQRRGWLRWPVTGTRSMGILTDAGRKALARELATVNA